MTYLLGVDLGTSGVKTILIDPEGRVVGRATAGYPLYSPRPLWSEQDPGDWWSATRQTIQETIRTAKIEPKSIGAVGLSGQMHGAVFLDESNLVIRRAILWNDQRTQSECDWITERVGHNRVIELISNRVLTGFTAGKIVWLRNNEPENYRRVKKVLLPKDAIRYWLTGEYATEVSDASGTALFDVKQRRWSEEMLAGADIPISWMPRCYESPEITGRITERASSETGLAAGTPVVGGGGDQAAGAVGNGIVESGIVSTSVGTSGVVFAYSDTPRVDPEARLHTFCHAVPGKWHLMGVMLSAGGSLRWYRDAFCQQESTVAAAMGKDPYEIITAEAEQAPPGCEGLIFLPYLTGERTPYPDPHARGVFFGLTLRCNRATFARSILEGVAFGLRDSFEIMRSIGLPMSESRASGGGSRSGLWRQILADITGVPHSTINMDEGPALGVALLAGVGCGVYQNVEQACSTVIRTVSRTVPDPKTAAEANRNYPIYRNLYSALKPAFDHVATAE